MTWTFVADNPAGSGGSEVPFFEDATARTAPNYSTDRKLTDCVALVVKNLRRLDASMPELIPGQFQIAGQTRMGYELRFFLGTVEGVIRIAGLPMRLPSAKKEDRVKAQALLTIADWLQNAYTARIFNPDMQPLLPFLLLPDGKTTVAQHITQQGSLPMLKG